MALIGHWPLTGNTDDYSGYNNNGSPTNVTWVDGKIGQAGEFTGSNSWIDLGNSLYLTDNHPFTLAGWMMHHTFSSRDMMMCRNDAVKSASPYTWLLGTRDGNRMYAYDGGSWHQASYSFSTNIWYHLTFVFDGSVMHFYVDGELIGTSNWSFSDSTTGRNTQIGGYSGSTGDVNGKKNDIRFYDHALSTYEVKELAKAKVLHYNFNNPYEGFVENIKNSNHPLHNQTHKWWSRSGTTTTRVQISDFHIRVHGTQDNDVSNGQYYYPSLIAVADNPGAYYTFSAKLIVNSANSGRGMIGFRNFSSESYLYFDALQPGKVYKQSHTVFIPEDETVIPDIRAAYDLSRDGTGYVDVEWFDMQVEKGTESSPFTEDERKDNITDVSGYKHVGIINDISTTPYISSDSIMGSNSANFFPGYFDTGSMLNFLQDESFTVSFWAKPRDHSHKASAAGGVIGKGHYYDNTWDVYIRNNNTFTFEVTGNPTRDGRRTMSVSSTLDQWAHYCFTYNNGTMKSYKDGTPIGTTTYTGTGDFTGSRTVKVGVRHTDTSRIYEGQLDDTRIYATALSDDDVKSLYEKRANIDKSGNLQTNEIELEAESINREGLVLELDPKNPASLVQNETIANNLADGGEVTGSSGGPGTGTHTPDPNNFPQLNFDKWGIFDFSGGKGMNVEDDLGQQSEMTFSVWFYKTSSGGEYMTDGRNNGGTWNYWNYNSYNINYSNTLRYNFGGSYNSSHPDFLNQWIHAVIVSDSSGSKLYLDGEEVASAGSLNVNLGKNFRIGARYTNSGQWGGYMGAIHIFNRRIPENEITQLYSAYKHRYIDSEKISKEFNRKGQAIFTDIDEVSETENPNASQEIKKNGTLTINGEFSEVD